MISLDTTASSAISGTQAAGVVTAPIGGDRSPLPTWAVEAAVDLSANGLLLAKPHGQVVFINRAARNLPLLNTCIGWVAQSDQPSFDAHSPSFATVIGSLPARRSHYVTIWLRGEPLALALTRLPSPARHPEEDLIAVVMPRAREPMPATLVYFCELHGMTPAESDVVGQLMLGMRPKAIAVARGVSEHTVRTQIRSILDKADVSGVRELVFLLDSLPPACGLGGGSD